MANKKTSEETAFTAIDLTNGTVLRVSKESVPGNGIWSNFMIPIDELKNALGLPQKSLIVDIASGGGIPVFTVVCNNFNANASIGVTDNGDGSATITSDIAIFSVANTRVRFASNENSFPGKHLDAAVTSTTVVTIAASDIFGTPEANIIANGKIRVEIIEG
jgi:hypothetical protein